MKLQIIISTLLFLINTSPVLYSQSVYPDKPSAWVNDYADLLSEGQELELNRKLSDYQDSTGTQIFIVTTNDHQGAPISLLAAEIGEKWGVGEKEEDNGVLILIYPADREIFIATGYGVEQYITDAVCKRIIEKEIKPAFILGDYSGGLDQAVNVMFGLLSGAFTAENYAGQEEAWAGAIAFIIILVLFIVLFSNARNRKSYSIGKDLPLWIALSMLSGSRRGHSGSFGSFRSGGGSFGGFGGFSGGGGGSFGGGGAGGRW